MRFLQALLFLLLVISCNNLKKESSASGNYNGSGFNLYSDLFRISNEGSYSVLTLMNPWQGSGDISLKYYISSSPDSLPPGVDKNSVIITPVNKVICMSTTHVAMACPVVDNRPKNGTIVIHGGAVHMSKESVMIDNKKVFGMMVMITPEGWISYEEPYYLTSLSQEHGIISLPTAVARKFKPGDLVGIIPVHSCLTANLAGGYILTDGSGADHMNERKYSLGDPIS